MKSGFYMRLAGTGMSKNKKLYIPYILTCIAMIMMYYIISFLSKNGEITAMPAGDNLQMLLDFGKWVIAIFSVILLFYTQSFLIRRRNKEFGLYNILGMGKRNLARILCCESFIIAVISLVGGIGCGVLLSKAAQLLMVNMLGGDASFGFSFDLVSAGTACVVYLIFFIINLLNSLRKIHVSKPVELLHSENVGEKPPKANWVFAILGLIILGIAYYIAVTIESPISAMFIFFIAVIMVIIATYLLFVAGSVVLCKILQKCKGYYYKTSHFVSVSSMAYRMKRNGAGLASICILSTMVLVIVSSTACLYLGKEDNFNRRYPRNIDITTTAFDATDIHNEADKITKEHGLEKKETLTFRYLNMGAFFEGNKATFDEDAINRYDITGYGNIVDIYIITLDDYNSLTNKNETLEKGEVLYYSSKSYDIDTLELEGIDTVKLKYSDGPFGEMTSNLEYVMPAIFLAVDSADTLNEYYEKQKAIYKEEASSIKDYYGFDIDCDVDEQVAVKNELKEYVECQQNNEDYPIVLIDAVNENKNGFYSMYSGLFFLGIMLGIVFLIAAVLIMYYKQITEGYEDKSRFDILQKVGMTKKEIRSSINSQVLTVFFLPLIMAGLHIAAAFNIMYRLLVLFGIVDKGILILIMGICYLVFAVFYVVVYKVTSKGYYGIVSEKN